MLKQAADFTASAALSDEQLELVSGGMVVDAGGNMPICPPPRTIVHGHGGTPEPGGPCGPFPY